MSLFKTNHLQFFLQSRPQNLGQSISILLSLFLVTFVFLMVGISVPHSLNFDETHYVPAARKIINGESPGNFEHPPLAKILIAASIKTFGDSPVGWRTFSAIFGSLTAIGLFALGLLLFKNYLGALSIFTLTVFNQFLFVQSRIAMLDPFMIAFLVGAAYFATWAFLNSSHKKALWALYLAGALLGLAASCKWLSLIYVLPLWGLFIVLWRPHHPFKRIHFIGAFVGCFAVFYLTPFVSYLFLKFPEGQQPTLWSLFSDYQLRLWTEQKLVTQSHPYESPWQSWPSMARPIWYLYEQGIAPNSVRGIILLGNPLVLWTGFFAFLWLIYEMIFKSFSLLRNYLVLAFALSWLSWFFIPRKITFFFYYYPAVLVLGVILATVFQELIQMYPSRIKTIVLANLLFLALSVGFFFYFLPILSAQEIPSPQLYQRMWFSSWI